MPSATTAGARPAHVLNRQERAHSMRLSRRTFLTATAVICLSARAALAAGDTVDANAIVTIMRGTWDRPDAQLSVWPVVARDGHALAGWTQGEMGGLALLKRGPKGWSVVLCANDHLAAEAALIGAEVPPVTAVRLAAGWVEATKAGGESTLAKFRRFEGVVRMDGSGHHPPGRAHGPSSSHGGAGSHGASQPPHATGH